MTLAAAEFMGDSDSEVAAIVAHELVHIMQYRLGVPADELEADNVGTLLLLMAGYDPYAMLGMLGRLQAASGSPDLLGQLLREYTDKHGSFPTRIAASLEALKSMCSSSPEVQENCKLYKSVVHPHFPDTMPLRQPTGKTK